jgi:hypothetical protein
MVRKLKNALFGAALISIAGAGTFAWAGHGGHGGGQSGHGWSGGHGGGYSGHGWSGGHGGASWRGGHDHYNGNHYTSWGHGYGNDFYGSYWPYLAVNYLYGSPYRSYYRPYASYSYPYYGYSYPSYSYPSSGDDCDCGSTVAESVPQSVVSVPVDGGQVEERLPEPVPQLANTSGPYAKVTVAELRDWLRLR